MIYRQPYIFFSAGNIEGHKNLLSVLDKTGKQYQEVRFKSNDLYSPGVMVNYTPENYEIIDSLAKDFGVQEYFSLSCNNEFCAHTPNETFVYNTYSMSQTEPLGDHIAINNTTFIHG